MASSKAQHCSSGVSRLGDGCPAAGRSFRDNDAGYNYSTGSTEGATMGSLMGALLTSVVIGGLVAVLIGVATARRGKANYRSAVTTGLVVAVAILLIAAMMGSFTQVEAGSVAVVKQFGRVVGVFQPGLNWKLPFIQETVRYRTQEILYETSEDPTKSNADYRDVEVDTATSDGQQILARYTVRFRIDGSKAADIVNNLGTEQEVVEKVVKANSRVHVRNILKQFPASDLYSGNVERAQEEITRRLADDFSKEGLDLIFFGLRSIQFTEAYRNAVEQKQIEKENIGVAQGEAESTRLRAQADAEAIQVKAAAQADANKRIAQSLDQNVINWQAIQSWNGDYPLVLGGSGSYILPGDLFNASASNSAPATTSTP
jgi:regulator of protease activity HflC (stomatin/prohibitin superfamily)